MAGITNYYVPSSMSKSYVENKRTEEGTRGYLQSEQEVDIQKQAAIQNLEQQYNSTIENAYASYLSNQRNINMSQMGEGYKQLYRQMQEKELASNIAQTNLSAAQARQELTTQASKAKGDIQAMKEQEISNLNRVQNTMQQYLNYIKSVTNEAGEGLLTEEQQKMYVDDLYETLYDLPIEEGYTDTSGKQALRYSEWVRSNLTGSAEDTAWGDWLYSGGLQDFMNAAKIRSREKLLEQRQEILKKEYSRIEEEERLSEENRAKDSYTVASEIIDNKTGNKYYIQTAETYSTPKSLKNIDLKNIQINDIFSDEYNQQWAYVGNDKKGLPRFVLVTDDINKINFGHNLW